MYLQLGLEDYAGSGSYALAPDSLKRLRSRLLADKSGVALQKVLTLAQKAGLALGTEQIPQKVRYTKALAPWLLNQAAVAEPVVRWLLAQKLYVSAPPER